MIVDGKERYYSNNALKNIIVGILGIFTGGAFFGANENLLGFYFFLVACFSIVVLIEGFDKGAKDIYEKEKSK